MDTKTNQEQLKSMIKELVEKTKNLKVNEAIDYIKELFPEGKFNWEKTYNSSDFYLDNREIIHLSKDNQSQLIIEYPGGDRFGSSLSEPGTYILFHNQFLVDNDALDIDLYLFFDNKYNQDNHILEYLDRLTEKHQLSEKEVITALKNSWSSVPTNILEQLSKEQLSTPVIKELIDCVSRVAASNRSNAYDQYMYGQYGGEDVSDWELSESAQFELTWNELPELVQIVSHDALENAWLMLSDTKSRFIDEQKNLTEDIIEISFLLQNKEKYLQDIRNRYHLLKEHEDFLTLSYGAEEFEDHPLHKINDMHYDLEELIPDKLMGTYKQEVHDIESTIKRINEDNTLLEQANDELSNKKFYFWQTKKKQDSLGQIMNNTDKISKNKESISNLQFDIKELQKSIHWCVYLKRNMEEMIRTNPLSEAPSLYWHYGLLTKEELDLNNFSKEDYINMVSRKIDSEVDRLNNLNKELDSVNKTLDKISNLNEGQRKESLVEKIESAKEMKVDHVKSKPKQIDNEISL